MRVHLFFLTLNPLFVGDNQELTSGSESDMSLSSMIFPNNCSGSDDSVGDGDPGVGMDHSMVLLDPSDLQVEDEHHRSNVWRLYFGSSYESELGNSPISGLVSSSVIYDSICSKFLTLLRMVRNWIAPLLKIILKNIRVILSYWLWDLCTNFCDAVLQRKLNIYTTCADFSLL